MICRYTLLERTIHWLAALTYAYVLLTGLAFYSPHLYWIAAILGGAPTSRFWHPWIALVSGVPRMDGARGSRYVTAIDAVGQSHGPPFATGITACRPWTASSSAKVSSGPCSRGLVCCSPAAMCFPEFIPAAARSAAILLRVAAAR